MKRLNLNTNWKYYGIILLCIAIIGFAYNPGSQVSESSEFHDFDSVIEEKIYKQEQAMLAVSERSDKLPSVMYKYIDDLPSDFYMKRYKFQYPVIQEDMDVCGLDKKYYNQPEWFISFEDTGIETILNAKSNRIGISGYPQIYPADQIIQTMSGKKVKTCTLLRTSYLTEFYIGVQPTIKYMNHIEIKPDHYGIEGLNIEKIDTEIAQKYLTVKVTPNEFYLRPSYPLFGGSEYNTGLTCKLFDCDENTWTKKLQIEVDIDKNTPKGYYAIGLDFGKPSTEQSVEWYKQFNLAYKTTGGIIGLNLERPPYQLLIKVV